MYTISRYIILVPIFIFILAVFVHYANPKQANTITTPIPTVQPKTVTPAGVKLNLKGPFSCNYKDNDLQVNGFIKNKKIYFEVAQKTQTTYAVINGNCGYKWLKGETTGEKMCGIGSYLSLYDTFSGMSIFNINSILSMIGQYAPAINMDPAKISSLAESCQKGIVDDMVFSIPTNVVFKDIQSITPSITP